MAVVLTSTAVAVPAVASTAAPAAAATPVLYRAVSLNGPAITAGGVSFEAGATAPNLVAGPNTFCDQTVTLSPPADADTSSLVRCSAWGSGSPGAQVTMTAIPTGSYQASLYVWEDNASETYAVTMNGTTVAPSVVSGAAGTWQVLGPYPVDITNGALAITTSGGAANLSALVVESTAGPISPNVAITAPATGGTVTNPATIVGMAYDPAGLDHVSLSIVDTANGKYWNGSAFQVGPAEVIPSLDTPGAASSTWSYMFTSPSLSSQPYQVTAIGHGSTSAVSGPSTSTFSLTGGGATGQFDSTKVIDSFVAGGSWSNALSADWLANGHLLVLTKAGIVYDVNPATGAQHVALDVSSKVFNSGEAGAMDLLVDPAGTGFYLYYAVASSDRLRISHFTLGSNAEQVIWTNTGLGYNSANPYHIGGSLNLGPDGKLYLGIGDQTMGYSQDLTNVFGKVLRINTDGTVPADNPFVDGAGNNIDEIWAYGLRNPYRSTFDPATGRYWVGDVGGNVPSTAYEEVDLIQKGANYGWPLCEGPLGLPKNGPVCPAGVTGPVYTYPHDPNGSQFFNRAIIGGEIYHGNAFPLNGDYLYADYPSHSFSWLGLGADGQTVSTNGQLTTVGTALPVWLSQGPDGNIYWLDLGPSGSGQLRRLTYVGAANQPPTITAASATPTSGAAPLAVSFTGAATDTDQTPITYGWDFGDGTTSSQASPSHTYNSKGVYQARLQVTSGGGTASSNLIPITVGTPPTASITSPADGATFNAGDTLTFSGTGFDPDTSAPLTGTSLTWNVQFLHDNHSHPGSQGSGSSITLQVPSTGHDFTGDTRYLVQLTATNASGISTTTSITVWPNKTTVALSSNAATTVTVSRVTENLPFSIDTAIGFQETIAVPPTACVSGNLWNFTSWSDNGAISHTITAAAGMNLVATYADSGTACSFSVMNHDPFGSVDVAAFGPSGIFVAGWAIDPDTAASTDVHVYVDGNGYALNASATRDDVAAAFPGYGSAHGFSAWVPAPTGSGPHTVCAYGINHAATPGQNVLLSCRTL